jgi:hypothetical protein
MTWRFGLIGLIFLSACDFIYGVRRVADIKPLPDLDCVRHVIETTPGIGGVEYRHTAGGRPLTWTGVQAPDQVYTFIYHGLVGTHILGVLQLIENYNGDVKFDHSLSGLNYKPPQEAIDATRPVMREIETELAAECSLGKLPANIQETCSGVDCTPLK